ncbi:hypothetical protein [Mucilaginibacter sp.]|uniref:hypothetical protein n=1 Tax=Mucilaginibacter sp. TaxID=1882438 RepID=UPI002600327A|nr:hypothetical protein [Mucilaginibacter sp.]
MKKILTLICCTVLIAATSCTKKYITPSANVTAIYTVKGTTGWKLSTDDNVSYTSELGKDGDLPELDTYAQENGGVLVYISYNNGTTYEAIPQAYAGISYSYITSVGRIVLYAQGVNGTKLPTAPADDIKVKVVLVDSAQ